MKPQRPLSVFNLNKYKYLKVLLQNNYMILSVISVVYK